jgi:hypothetical protein
LKTTEVAIVMLRWKVLFVVVSFLYVSLSAFAIDVDQEELSNTKETSVEFISYEGPHDRIDTIEQIIGIGRALARSPKDRNGAATIAGKYRIVHSVSPSESQKLDADILYLLSTAEVDHIDNVRRILAGYLETAYSYEISDALLLSEFISVYNAVYRKRMTYFQDKYKRPVIELVSAESVGLATVYSQWPGNTQIVVPLSDRALTGGIGSLDSDVLTEDDVIDELREREDQGIPIRKEITELKEREVELAQREIDDERTVVSTDRERVERDLEKIDAEREALSAEGDSSETEGGDDETSSVAVRQSALDEQENALREEQRILAEQEASLDERETEQADRIERIQTEREQIAVEERAILDEEAKSGITTGITGISGSADALRAVLFLRTRTDDDTGEPFSRLVYIDQTTNSVIAQSSTNTIRGRRTYDFADAVLVVAGDDTNEASPHAVKLMLIDQETLDTIIESDESVSPRSWVTIESPETILTTFADVDGWLVGRFDADLTLVRASAVRVDPNTTIQVGENLIFVQSATGTILGLDPASLTPTREFD